MEERTMSERTDARPTRLKEHNISLRSAVMIMYCLVAAGAFGIEEMIPESGPGMTVIMLCVLPFLWAGPQALVSAELGSAMPEVGGFYKWVQRGLGEFWGFQACWCRTLSCYLDNTLYIVLAVSYVGFVVPMGPVQSYLLKAAFIFIFSYINIRGLREISWVSNVISITILATFAVIAVTGLTHWEYNPVSPLIPEDYTLFASVGASLSIGMWMYSGYTAMSNLAGEIKDKSVIYRGLLIVLPLTTLSYVLPTVASLASVGQWEEWSTTGGVSFGHTLAILGSWGIPVFMIVATLSNLSIFNTQMVAVTRGFFSMSEDNLAPKAISRLHKRFRTPYVGILSMTVFCLIACTFDFSILVTVDVMLLMVDYVLVFFSAARLRYTEPDMERPFRIPLGRRGVALLVSPAILIALFALFLNGADYFLGGMAGLVSSPVVYVIWRRMYGGMSKIDPEAYPSNPRTKLGKGDLHRTAIIFLLFGALGVIGAFAFFPWYEADWGEYYMEVYGGTDPFAFIILAIKCLSVVYLITGIVLKYFAVKIDPKSPGAGIW
ncbi:MAG: APC family permease [Clostridiales Family XIII bacterium]|jgi:amino acid transporter|nr:APC family permease [Clostridiales Family XIII bacterium]